LRPAGRGRPGVPGHRPAPGHPLRAGDRPGRRHRRAGHRRDRLRPAHRAGGAGRRRGRCAGMIADTALQGSLLLAVPLAVAAGLVPFLSPCVLPLVPGYLSYVTSLSGADIAARNRAAAAARAEGAAVRTLDEELETRRWTMLAGSLLFIAGFTFVFVTV